MVSIHPRRGRALLALLMAAPLLGGCSQRMAAKINGEPISEEQFYKRCATFTRRI